MRIEQDSIGKMEISDEALYGINALRAARNFPITNEKVDSELIRGLVMVKKAAAITNKGAGTLSQKKSVAIVNACNDLLRTNNQSSFIVPSIQGGAGTSTNMNANEVIANLAMKLDKHQVKILPNDDVNQSQSTNDVYPTAGKIAMLNILFSLIDSIKKLIKSLKYKSGQYKDTVKVGRTQLQDAVPTTYGKSFHAYASAFQRDVNRLIKVKNDLSQINLGGTAIGTGMNASDYYKHHVTSELVKISGLNLKQADDLIDATQNSDDFLGLSNAMKTLSVNLSKMSNDLRLLASGPQDGLSEINLPKRQNGSSIMPTKINPVIPEMVNQVAFETIGKNGTVTMAAEAGQLELNAFEPIMFRDILVSERHLTSAIDTLVDKCIMGIEVNTKECHKEVDDSVIAATILSPKLGYHKTTELISTALKQHISVKTLLRNSGIINKNNLDRLFSTENLVK